MGAAEPLYAPRCARLCRGRASRPLLGRRALLGALPWTQEDVLKVPQETMLSLDQPAKMTMEEQAQKFEAAMESNVISPSSAEAGAK